MTTPYLARVNAWEAAWSNYIDKLERLNELKAQGRYGYQLRMPKLAVRRAHDTLQEAAADHINLLESCHGVA